MTRRIRKDQVGKTARQFMLGLLRPGETTCLCCGRKFNSRDIPTNRQCDPCWRGPCKVGGILEAKAGRQVFVDRD